MPFSKVSEALAMLQNIELCSDGVREIHRQLMEKEIEPADACFQIFELDLGGEMLATYVVCYFAIMQNKSTTVESVAEQMKKLSSLQHGVLVKDKPDHEPDEVDVRDVSQRIQNLISRRLLRLREGETILLPK